MVIPVHDINPVRRTPWVTYLLVAVNVVVLLLTPEAFLPLRAVGAQFHASMEGAAAATRVFEILDTPTPGLPQPGPTATTLRHAHADWPLATDARGAAGRVRARAARFRAAGGSAAGFYQGKAAGE